jgi:hypothetical protein
VSAEALKIFKSQVVVRGLCRGEADVPVTGLCCRFVQEYC